MVAWLQLQLAWMKCQFSSIARLASCSQQVCISFVKRSSLHVKPSCALTNINYCSLQKLALTPTQACYALVTKWSGVPDGAASATTARVTITCYSQSIAPTPAWRSAVLPRGFARPCTQRNSIYNGNTADTRVFERHRRLSSVIGRAATWPRCSRVVRITRAQRKITRRDEPRYTRTQTISAHAMMSPTTFMWHDSVAVE